MANEPTTNPPRSETPSAFTGGDGGARPRQAVILAGGEGLRANPQSAVLHKSLFAVHDRTLIEGQIAIIRDQLGISDIIVLVGHLKDQVKAAIGSGERLGVSIRYVDVSSVGAGPAKALLDARPMLEGPFFVFLADEFHPASKHGRMLDLLNREPDVVFTYTRTINPHQILANFAIEIEPDGRVRSIEEKPKKIINELCGCGTLYLTPKVIDAIAGARPSARTGRVELYEVAASFIPGGKVFGADLDDPDYANINTIDDLRRATFTYRSHHFSEFKISVVVPAWNEAHSIEYVVKDFLAQPQVVEVVVMDNNSADGTGEIARRAGARVIGDKYLGYGDAIHKGLNAATGDVLVVTEADYSFRAADLPKLLEYLKDADMVVGTRTTRQLIAQGANMDFLARLGNVIMAKYFELLWFWLMLRLTDVGCSYRAIWRREWLACEGAIRCLGPDFAPEMVLEIVKARKICIEIPVSYHPRFGGESKHSKGLVGLTKTALKMWRVITGRWIETVWRIVKLRVQGER